MCVLIAVLLFLVGFLVGSYLRGNFDRKIDNEFNARRQDAKAKAAYTIEVVCLRKQLLASEAKVEKLSRVRHSSRYTQLTSRSGGRSLSQSRRKQIARVSAKVGIDPKLVEAVVSIESGGNAGARNGQYQGLMQIGSCVRRAYHCKNGFDSEQNLRAGAAHLKVLVDQHGVQGGLARYNAGPKGRVGGPGDGYARKVLRTKGCLDKS